jgi:hypothetical protein
MSFKHALGKKAAQLVADGERASGTSPLLRFFAQMLVMAAIVTTALAVPVGALLAFLCFALFDVSLWAFITLGGSLTLLQGLFAWWALMLVPAIVYAASVMAWHGSD